MWTCPSSGSWSAPAVQPPNRDVDFPTVVGIHQFLAKSPLGGSGVDLFHLQGDRPGPPGVVFAQAVDLWRGNNPGGENARPFRIIVFRYSAGLPSRRFFRTLPGKFLVAF